MSAASLRASSILASLGTIANLPIGEFVRQGLRLHGAFLPLLAAGLIVAALDRWRCAKTVPDGHGSALLLALIAAGWTAVYLVSPHAARHPDGAVSAHWVVRNLRLGFPALALISVFAGRGLGAALSREKVWLLVAAGLIDLLLALARETVPVREVLSPAGIAYVLGPAALAAALYACLLRDRRVRGPSL